MSFFEKELDKIYNKPPKKWHVPFFVKVSCFLFFVSGLAAYAFFIAYRKSIQNNFIEQHTTSNTKTLETLMVYSNDEITGFDLFTKYSGKWILLNVWTTYCPVCVAEMPSLEKLTALNLPNLEIIALSANDTWQEVEDYRAKNQHNFHIYWDKDDITFNLLGTTKYPETFLISPNKKIVLQINGGQNWADDQIVQKLKRNIEQTK